MTYKINTQAVDTWNKENPDEQFTYQECEDRLDEQIDDAVEGLRETINNKIEWWSNLNNWSELDDPADCFDYRCEFNTLVVDRFLETFHNR